MLNLRLFTGKTPTHSLSLIPGNKHGAAAGAGLTPTVRTIHGPPLDVCLTGGPSIGSLPLQGVEWSASCCCTCGLLILRHTLPPGCTRCQPQLADLLSHSIRIISIRHTPVPAVSALHSQPARQPRSEHHLMLLLSPNCQGAITSSQHIVFSSDMNL
ncbi:hypothetical protein PAMP_017807 [Pampus punctatissimus]